MTTDCPDTMTWLSGCIVMIGATPIVMVAVAELTIPNALLTRTQ